MSLVFDSFSSPDRLRSFVSLPDQLSFEKKGLSGEFLRAVAHFETAYNAPQKSGVKWLNPSEISTGLSRGSLYFFRENTPSSKLPVPDQFEGAKWNQSRSKKSTVLKEDSNWSLEVRKLCLIVSQGREGRRAPEGAGSCKLWRFTLQDKGGQLPLFACLLQSNVNVTFSQSPVDRSSSRKRERAGSRSGNSLEQNGKKKFCSFSHLEGEMYSEADTEEKRESSLSLPLERLFPLEGRFDDSHSLFVKEKGEPSQGTFWGDEEKRDL